MPFLVHLILYHIDTDTKIIADNDCMYLQEIRIKYNCYNI